MRRRAVGAASLAVLPLLACVAAGLVMADYRFMLVGLMLVFVAYPGVVAIAWLSMVSAPDVALKLRPQTWTFGESFVGVIFYSYGDEPEPVDSAEISFGSLKKIEIRGDFAYFFTAIPTFCSKGEYYIIPASLLPSGLAQRLTEQIYDRQQ